MKNPKLTPFELDVFQSCQNIFENTTVEKSIPFPLLKLKEGLFLNIISLQKLTSALDLTYFETLSDEFDRKKQQILFLWEDQWQNKQQIIASRLKSFAQYSSKIHGRATKCQRIDKKTFFDFLSENHLQGPVNSKFKFGLYKKEELVAVAGFSNPKKYYRNDQISKSTELIRFCNLKGHTVIGGFDKFLKHFINHHEVDDIMSYADRDWSNGKSYERLGFTRVENAPPTSFWIHQKELARIAQHQAFSQLGTDNEEVLFNKGYQKIVNSGNIKYIKFLSKS